MGLLIVQPAAQTDIDEALEWYYAIQEKLAGRLLRELDVVFDRIAENPEQFPVIGKSVRRALLRKFPYNVYFVLKGDAAFVLAMVHQKRHPRTWKRR